MTTASTSQSARQPKRNLTVREKSSTRRVLVYAGAIMAFLIGSGFATGQDVMQYMASYGFWGIFGGGAIILFSLTFVGAELLQVGYGQAFKRPSRIFHYYGGKWLGTFLDYFSVLAVFLSFAVMVAGAGAVFEEHYNLSKFIGGIGLSALVSLVVWFGLGSMVDVIGKIGPLIAVVAVAIGAWGVIQNPARVAEGNSLIPELAASGELLRASTSWWLAALSYVGICILWLAAFLTELGRTSKTRIHAVIGGSLGGMGFGLSMIIIAAGILAHIAEVAGKEIPMLILARHIAPWLASGVSLMMLAGIFTTAVPLLWTASSRIYSDQSKEYKYLTLVLAFIGTVIGLLIPFSRLVNTVYLISGYVGVILMGLMLVKTMKRKVTGEKLDAHYPQLQG